MAATEPEAGICCYCEEAGWDCEPRYLRMLIPVPGMMKETQSDPVGERPMRKPARPQLIATTRMHL